MLIDRKLAAQGHRAQLEHGPEAPGPWSTREAAQMEDDPAHLDHHWPHGHGDFVTWSLLAYRAQGPERATALESDARVTVTAADGYWSFTPRTPARAGLIFFPGALVDPVAYAPLVHAIADAGYTRTLDPGPAARRVRRCGGPGGLRPCQERRRPVVPADAGSWPAIRAAA